MLSAAGLARRKVEYRALARGTCSPQSLLGSVRRLVGYRALRAQNPALALAMTALAHSARSPQCARAFQHEPMSRTARSLDVGGPLLEPLVTVRRDVRERRGTLAWCGHAIWRLTHLAVRLVRTCLRAAELLFLFGPLVLTSWVPFMPGAAGSDEASRPRSHQLATFLSTHWWQWLRRTIEVSGPCVIKLAQWASSRPDLFSERVTRLFASVTDQVSHHPASATRRTLRRAFGPRWSEELQLAATPPIGSGCIAQVHKATLLRGGERLDVAVKVVHPGVASRVRTDLDLLHAISVLISLVPGAVVLDPIGVASEFAAAMLMQLDLSLEAHNLEELAANFSAEPRVRFPQPVRPWVTQEVLVEELIVGRPVLESVRSPQRKLIARVGLEAVLKMLFIDNCTHADLHPGNILVCDRPASRGGGPPEREDEVVLAFLDAGMVKRVGPSTFRVVVGVLGAMVHYDGLLAGELLLAHSPAPRPGEDRSGFCEGIKAIVDHAKKPEVHFFDHIGEYVGKILSLSYKHHVQLEPDFVAVAIAVRVVEGIAHQLDPNVSVAPLCRPFYLRAIREHGFSGLSAFGGFGTAEPKVARSVAPDMGTGNRTATTAAR